MIIHTISVVPNTGKNTGLLFSLYFKVIVHTRLKVPNTKRRTVGRGDTYICLVSPKVECDAYTPCSSSVSSKESGF